MDLAKIYNKRFNAKELENKKRLWNTLIQHFLKKYINYDSTVVDIGAGTCEFINQIVCKRKIAVDLNPTVKSYAADNVEVLISRADNIIGLKDNEVNIVFVSNFFEHLESRQELLKVITEIRRVLKPGDRVLVIQPNIKYAYREYWDFCDHYLPLSDKGMIEFFCSNGFEIVTSIPRFLPFSTKTPLSKYVFLFKIYIHLSILWHIFGKQFFLVAKKIED